MKDALIVLVLTAAGIVAIGALLYYSTESKLRCYEQHAERETAELVLMCK